MTLVLPFSVTTSAETWPFRWALVSSVTDLSDTGSSFSAFLIFFSVLFLPVIALISFSASVPSRSPTFSLMVPRMPPSSPPDSSFSEEEAALSTTFSVALEWTFTSPAAFTTAVLPSTALTSCSATVTAA